MGTTVTYGRGRAVIVASGMSTEIGRITELNQSYEEETTPLQNCLDQLDRRMGQVQFLKTRAMPGNDGDRR